MNRQKQDRLARQGQDCGAAWSYLVTKWGIVTQCVCTEQVIRTRLQEVASHPCLEASSGLEHLAINMLSEMCQLIFLNTALPLTFLCLLSINRPLSISLPDLGKWCLLAANQKYWCFQHWHFQGQNKKRNVIFCLPTFSEKWVYQNNRSYLTQWYFFLGKDEKSLSGTLR